MNRRHTLALLCAFAALTGTQLTWAQGRYPDHPITLVVPSAPGGSTDFSARLIADALSRSLGQPVIVDNKPGGSGNVGNQAVARAKPDGHTLLVAYSGYQVGNPHLFNKAGWDPIKDFAPVAMVMRAPQVVAARAGLPANTLGELIAYAKANPDKLNYASSGNGSIQHIAGELLRQLIQTAITHIPYRGSGPAVQDLLGGQVDLHITTPASVVSHIKAGELKGLAVTSAARLPALPQVPTAAESGLKGFTLDSWFAVYAPAAATTAACHRLQAIVQVARQPAAHRSWLESTVRDLGIESMTTPEISEQTTI